MSHFFIFISIRDPRYLYHVLFNSGWVLAMLTLNGLAFQYLCAIWWANNSLLFFFGAVEQVLEPTLRPGDIVSMDKLRAHKVADIREAIAQAGAPLVYWPPYSPDRSPIERCWSKLKTALRNANARTRGALDHAMAQALASITVSDARRWFHHFGYALQ